MKSRMIKRCHAVMAMLIAVVACLASAAPGDAAVSHAQISGTGSSWSANAVNQWVADVQSSGLQVVYTSNGSAQGRRDFASYNNDFAVSDIGYQGSDPKTGASDASSRPYAYLPIVAGGTAFPYHITVAGKRVTNLRLSPATILGIFTGTITDWSDSSITADNNGRALPSKKIIPVVHSEGAGSTAQFTMFLANQFPSQWTAFNGNANFTEYYPSKSFIQAQNGSDGVMNYITAASGEGTIGYDEYSYALSAGYPVAKVLNKGGYYTEPTQYNDAVALTQAVINTDPTSPNYLLQNLSNVYTYTDPRTYPLSSYSYAIIPTSSGDSRMTTAKRQTLADFLFYSVCGGQAEMGKIGYSPLPLNLVQGSFDQIKKLNTADPNVQISSQSPANCDNPTFDKSNPNANKLAEIAPQPQACDKQAAGPCLTGTGGAANTTNSAGSSNTGTSTGTTKNAASSNNKAKTSTAGNGSSATAALDTGSTAVVDSSSGGDDSSSDGTQSGIDAEQLQGNPTTLRADERLGSNVPYAAMAVVMLLIVLIAPPLLVRQLRAGQGSR